MLKYELSQAPPVRPKRIRFGLLSAEEIARMSVCKVTDTMLYYRGLPASGGLLDPLMGSVDRRHHCATCNRDPITCQGHAGHMELAWPVYHIGYVETVLKTLRCLCFCCARVVATAEEARVLCEAHPTSGRARLHASHAIFRARKVCPHCDMTRPTLSRTSLGIKVAWADDTPWECDDERDFCTAPFTARDAFSLLDNLSDADATLLGFDPVRSHPKHMIVQNLVVPPPCTRPAIYSSEGSRSRGQNDLTVRFLEILRRSNEVASALGSRDWRTTPNTEMTPDLSDRIARLQYEVFMMVNNSARVAKPPGMGRNSSNANGKSIQQRLKGKEGRVRGHLMGKRTNFSARAVITPDAYFECDRVGVPYALAKTLTIGDTVNATNIRDLAQRVKNGAKHIHGAQTVIHASGHVTDLATCKDRASIVLRAGDTVERHLADDDVVVFNRQPSLHLHSMVAHRVRLMPGNTFRIALTTAAPYNADFDGDEMNLHVPQSKASAAECATIMAIAQNCLGAQANKPVMGIVQDSLLGLHNLTHPDVLFDHAHLCRLMGSLRHFGTERSPTLPRSAVRVRLPASAWRRYWTGKQAFSLVLPEDFYLEPDQVVSRDAWRGSARGHGVDDANEWRQRCLTTFVDAELPVVVRAGKLVCGVLRKAHAGTAAGGIVDVLCREYGGVACLRFMGDAQRLTHAFLLQRSHSVGIEDVMLSSEGHDRVNERLAKATQLCEEIQREMLDAPPSVARKGEASILRILSKTLQQTGAIVNEHMSERNAIRRMVNAGSKGSFLNLSQIAATLGQQSLAGKRITADKGTRTLSCFAHNDVSLASRGMVVNSFALGLSPPELFFHAVGGREGLVDTAVKTSQTGYLQRRMNKAMEDNTVQSDGTVRNASREIVSFVWGGDGMHPAKLERAKLALLTESETSLRRRLTAVEAEMALESRERILRVKRHVLMGDFDPRVLLPFHPQRLKQRILRETRASRGVTEGLGDEEGTRRLLALIQRVCVDESPGEFVANHVLRAALIDCLCGSAVAEMDADAHALLLASLVERIEDAHATPGDGAGCLAAQSVGEPATQLTLNSFHTSGVAEKNVTLGIPRLKELIDASKIPKTPYTTLRLRAPYGQHAGFAEYVSRTLPLTRLSDVVLRCDIVWDPDPTTTVVPDDAWMVETEASLRPDGTAASSSSYVVRIELHQEVMTRRRLTPPMIRRMLAERLHDRASVVSSEVNCVDWVVRIRFARVKDMLERGGLPPEHEALLCHRALNMLLDTMVVCGHPRVTDATTEAVKNSPPSRRALPGQPNDEEHVVHAYASGFLSDCVALDVVDWTRTTSNDVWEVYHTLGVEACIHVLFEQIKTVVSFQGTYVDDRHILMICDTICRTGTMVPLNRHGINKSDASPLMRCSFEETIDVLCEAAVFAQHENATGASASIMTGQMADMGTGMAQILLPDSGVDAGRLQPRGRVMRSTCRSHTLRGLEETVEYVVDDARVSGTRPLSPPTVGGEGGRKRARFRPTSPS